MIEIAKLSADDRRELFHNTAAKTGLHDAIVEKGGHIYGRDQLIQRVSPYQPVF